MTSLNDLFSQFFPGNGTLNDKLYKALSNTGGRVLLEDGGTEVDIQNAIDNLTSGRTSKEKIVLIGDFTISNVPITIPSYTQIELQGNLTTDGSETIDNDSAVFELESGAQTDIDIFGGGTIDCNQTGGDKMSGIIITSGTRVNIDGIKVLDAFRHGIELDACVYSNVRNCVVNGHGDDGITLHNSEDCSVTANDISGGTSAKGVSFGVEVEGDCHRILVNDNYIHDSFEGQLLKSGLKSFSGSRGANTVLPPAILIQGS